VDGCVGGGYCLPRCLVTVVLKCGLLSFGQGIFPFGPVLGPTSASFVSHLSQNIRQLAHVPLPLYDSSSAFNDYQVPEEFHLLPK